MLAHDIISEMPIKPSWVNDRFLSTRILTDSKIDGRQTKWPWSGNEFWSGPDFFFLTIISM